MPAKFRVFVMNYDGRTERMVAARAKLEAARLIGVPLSDFAEHAGITGHKEECELALHEPGIVWSRKYGARRWERVTPAGVPAAIQGVEFLHRRILDPDDLTKPARCIVTSVRQETIYYRMIGESRSSEYTTPDRWPEIASAIPPTQTP